MTYPYNTFEAWLQAHGLGSYLDGDGELKDGTSQGFFSSQYTGWLADLINYYGEAIRNQYGLPADCQFLVSINQSDPNGLPVISGLTQAQVDDLFDDTSAFSWTSGSKPAIHTRYYSNSFNVQALEVNHAPTADNVQAGSAEDAGSIAIALTGSDPDSGDAIESFTLTSLPPATAGVLFTDSALSNAAVTGVAYTATGEALTLYFVPASNFYGKVEFTYNASDGALASTEAATTITVTQVNDAAGFGGDTTGNGNEDSGAILGTLTVSDVADGMTVPNFRIESGDGPSDGVAIIDANTGQWNYTPNANFNGADHFMVSVTDDDGNVETRVVDITVNPTPDAAVAHDDAFTASEDFGVSGNVLANDSNLDNETLTVVALSGVSAADSLTRIVVSEIMANPVGVSDADGEWFEVYNAGAFPVDLNGWTIQIGGHPILIDSPTPLLVAPGSFFVVAANGDSTANGGLPFVGYETGPLGLANGGTTIVLFDGDGHEIDSVDYSGSSFPPDQEGYSFSLLDAAADNNQGEFWQNTSNSDLYGVAGNHGTPWAPPLVFGGGDAAGDPPVIGEPAIFPSGALLTLNSDGTFNFDSNGAYDYLAKGQTTTEQFSYTLSDGHGGLQTATVTLTIDGKNDAPVSVGETFATTEDVPLVAGSVLANDSDVDVGTVLTASLVDAPGHGSITLNSNGTFSYIPDANFNGTDSFTYVANDGLADSNVATVTIDVFAANDAPVAQGDQFTTSSANQLAGNVLLNDSDVDGDSLMAVSLAGLSPQDVVPKIVISEIMPNPT
ncbi:MAG TPA: Ig-like domain-containing protein, partial [Terriglobia bacterium]|nr:Ig-like domain-containing protein [Terriglobia bacterium]